MTNNKIDYDLMTVEAEKLFAKVAAGGSQEEVFAKYKDYTDYIKACGWTVSEYDQEQIKRIDAGWSNSQAN